MNDNSLEIVPGIIYCTKSNVLETNSLFHLQK